MINLENELLEIDNKIEGYALAFGMSRSNFLEKVGLIEASLAYEVAALLEQKISLLQKLWKIRIREEGISNVLLFGKRTKVRAELTDK